LVDAMGVACDRFDEDSQRMLLRELVPEMIEQQKPAPSEINDSNVVPLNRYNA